MWTWKTTPEPSLDELLDDEVMIAVMRSAGLTSDQMRAQLVELAGRLSLAWADESSSGGPGAC
jgi:hypothetical protein